MVFDKNHNYLQYVKTVRVSVACISYLYLPKCQKLRDVTQKNFISIVPGQCISAEISLFQELSDCFVVDQTELSDCCALQAYASSEAKSTLMQLPKIPSFHKFARREQYGQVDEYDFRKKWPGAVLGRQDCISEIDSRNCRVRDWSVDFSATCVNLDNSRISADNISQRSHSNEIASHLNFREHSGESAAADCSLYTKAWVDTAGTVGIKDYHAIERWQSQAAAADSHFFDPNEHIRDEEDSNASSRQRTWQYDGRANESSVSHVTVNKDSVKSHHRGADRIKQAVVDYVASLLMPLYKAKKIDREGYKSIMKKSATKVSYFLYLCILLFSCCSM